MLTTIINKAGATSAAAVKSAWFAHGDGPLSLQIITTGTLTATIQINVSNKPNADTLDDTESVDVTSGFQTPAAAAITNPSGSPLTQFVQTTYLKAGWVNVIVTIQSGTGDVRVHLGG